MDPRFLVITSIASSEHPILKQFAREAKVNNTPFILIGDSKSPKEFKSYGL